MARRHDPHHTRVPSSRSRRAFLAAGAALLALGTTACGPGPLDLVSRSDRTTGATGGPTDACQRSGRAATVAYRAPQPGDDPDATSVDVHPLAADCHAPVVLWVHGGGYHIGDKANQIDDKVALFNGNGWLLVSVNYRLTTAGDPDSAHFPDHYEDVAAAVAWTREHIAEHGGDPSRIALLGHSAGADIVSNVTVRPQYLGAHDLELSTVRCAGTLDTAGFDKPAVPADADERRQWEDALGNNPKYLTDTSATRWIKPGIGIPATISVVRGNATRQQIEKGYLAGLTAAGVRTVAIDASSLSHEEVNSQIGAPGDTVMTPPLVDFLGRCFA